MKEDFLHHVWLHKRIDVTQLFTTKKEKIEILKFGQYLQTSGPDFFNAQLIIANQKWAGNIEIHVKSSDWYLHNHEKDKNYDNVILHVVWEHDIEIYRSNNTEIPVLELKQYIKLSDVNRYKDLFRPKKWINCENQINKIDNFKWSNWKERLFFERLERKSEFISSLLVETKNDWDAVLFCLLAKNFGLNINGDSFLEIAKSIPFSVIRKEKSEVENLEALFFGMANLLESDFQDEYCSRLKTNWQYLKIKYALKDNISQEIQFFKLRPDNFPTIRLSQFAELYNIVGDTFSKCIEVNKVEDIYALFSVKASNYWASHYNFEKESVFKVKKTTKSFIDLITINTIIPIKFLYSNYLGKENFEELIDLLKQIQPENNAVIKRFASLELDIKSAFDSQSLIQLKNEYCNHNRCLKCNVGIELIKN